MIKIMVDSASDCRKSDSNCDLFIPLTVNIDGTEYLDGETLESNTFYDLLVNSEEFPKTSQPSPQRFVEIFEQIKESKEELIYISLSAGLSGTYQSAMLAKDIVDYDGIYVINSNTATHGIRFLLDYAKKLVSEEKSAIEIVDALEAVKGKVKIIAGLDTLEYLQKGGRLSKTAAAVGELANIKPLITLSEDGKVNAYCKCLGPVRAIKHIMNDIELYEIDESFPFYTIYTMGEEHTEKLESKLIAKGYNVKGRLQVGSTIGAHIGPGAYGVVFVAK